MIVFLSEGYGRYHRLCHISLTISVKGTWFVHNVLDSFSHVDVGVCSGSPRGSFPVMSLATQLPDHAKQRQHPAADHGSYHGSCQHGATTGADGAGATETARTTTASAATTSATTAQTAAHLNYNCTSTPPLPQSAQGL